MKKFITLATILVSFHQITLAQAVKYNITSLITKFGIKNAGITVNGNFKTGTATLSIDKNNIANSKFIGIVNANSINTSNKLRDGHLKDKPEFFDVAKYPQIKLESTKIVAAAGGKYNVTWNLTMKGVTKAITVPMTVAMSGDKVSLKTDFVINRRDWGVGEKSIMMKDNVAVSIAAESVPAK